MPSQEKAGRYSIQVVNTSLGVLDELAHRPWQNSKEVAQHLNITHTQAFRILATLEGTGYVQRDALKRYAIGYKAFVLGHSAQQEVSLIQQAATVLDDLQARTSENVHLVKRDGLERIVVDVRASTHRIRLVSPIGNRHPLHIGGTGLVILAHSPSDVIEAVLSRALPSFTEFTQTQPDQIRENLLVIRQRGFHVALQDFDPDAFSVAAPVFNADGSVDAALCITGPLMRLDEQKQMHYIQLVQEKAHQLSTSIGYNPAHHRR